MQPERYSAKKFESDVDPFVEPSEKVVELRKKSASIKSSCTRNKENPVDIRE